MLKWEKIKIWIHSISSNNPTLNCYRDKYSSSAGVFWKSSTKSEVVVTKFESRVGVGQTPAIGIKDKVKIH